MRTVHVTAPHPEISELLTLLFSRGADVNIVGKDRNTPLFTAINEEMFKTAIDLIERGADVNHIGANNLTTLECCFAVLKKTNKELRPSHCRYQICKMLYLLIAYIEFFLIVKLHLKKDAFQIPTNDSLLCRGLRIELHVAKTNDFFFFSFLDNYLFKHLAYLNLILNIVLNIFNCMNYVLKNQMQVRTTYRFLNVCKINVK